MNPRDRIATHLRRILVAAGMALPAAGHGDTSTPKPSGKPDNGKPPVGDKKPEKEPEHLGYEVVDMLPEPFIQPKEFGHLDLKSKSAASILIDGRVPPEAKPPYKLSVGPHTVTLTDAAGNSENFTVQIKKGKTTVERHHLQPSPAPKTEKKK